MQNHLEEIITSLSREKVQFIICGGVAAVLHGVERMTVDIDLSVEMSHHNLKKFLKVMHVLSLKPRAPVPGDILFDGEKLKAIVKGENALVFTFLDPKNLFRQVDIFISEKMDYHALIGDCIIFRIGGYSVRVLSKARLIRMKSDILPMRDHDKWDIRELRKLIKKRRKK